MFRFKAWKIFRREAYFLNVDRLEVFCNAEDERFS